MTKIFGVFLFLLAIFACLAYVFHRAVGQLQYFHPTEYKVISEGMVQRGVLRLTLSEPKSENRVCPGISVHHEAKDGVITYGLIAAPLGATALVDKKVKRDKNGDVYFDFPFDGNKIELVDVFGNRHGGWTIGHPEQ